MVEDDYEETPHPDDPAISISELLRLLQTLSYSSNSHGNHCSLTSSDS